MTRRHEYWKRAFRFRCLENAQRFAEEADVPMAVVMGEHPWYWVLRMADFERAIRDGFEPVETRAA